METAMEQKSLKIGDHINCVGKTLAGETKLPKNRRESLFIEEAQRDGWSVIKKGWPDFFVFRQGENGEMNIMLVEVKGSRHRGLKKHQFFVLRVLAEAGIPCYKWIPGIGYSKILSTAEYFSDLGRGAREATAAKKKKLREKLPWNYKEGDNIGKAGE